MTMMMMMKTMTMVMMMMTDLNENITLSREAIPNSRRSNQIINTDYIKALPFSKNFLFSSATIMICKTCNTVLGKEVMQETKKDVCLIAITKKGTKLWRRS